jgi:signal transduction histidine kinase
MMHLFLANNRDDLIERCKAKVAARPRRGATAMQLANGVPMFLDQLVRTLEAEEAGKREESVVISGPSGGDTLALSEIGTSAAAHGGQLVAMGYTVDEVVHDYGDLCQAITNLAFERDAPFTVDEFRTLNRCLDNAIADAVAAFSHCREEGLAREQLLEANERLGGLAHELRNALGTASMAFSALEYGNMTVGGATGEVLGRSLASLGSLVERSLSATRAGISGARQTFPLAAFVEEAAVAARLDARAASRELEVAAVDPELAVHGDRELLAAALANLLQNAFKFSSPGTGVTLRAYSEGDRALIDVADHCGGLAHGVEAHMFSAFSRVGNDRSGLGLGLSIARRSVEADLGALSVRDIPGVGCVFTISLPLCVLT